MRVLGRSSGQIRLMLLSLSMSEIRSFVRVESETESTFERSQVISENVGIL